MSKARVWYILDDMTPTVGQMVGEQVGQYLSKKEALRHKRSLQKQGKTIRMGKMTEEY